MTKSEISFYVGIGATFVVAIFTPWDEESNVPDMRWEMVLSYLIVIGWCFWYQMQEED